MKKEHLPILIFVTFFIGGIAGIAARAYVKDVPAVQNFEDFGAKTSFRHFGNCDVFTTVFPNDPSPKFYINCGGK